MRIDVDALVSGSPWISRELLAVKTSKSALNSRRMTVTAKNPNLDEAQQTTV